MEDIRREVTIESIQRMQEHEDVLDNLAILHVPDIDNNETNEILNFLNLQQEVPLANPGWVDINDDELMDMTAIFQ
eukprot:8887735-Ditylum_brightwellii.AAC.1